jgi:hypothetical protein
MSFSVEVERHVHPEVTGAVRDVAPAAANLRDEKKGAQGWLGLIKSDIAKFYEDFGEDLERNKWERSAGAN